MYKCIGTSLFTFLFLIQNASASVINITSSFGTELMNGDSTYQIGGKCEPASVCDYNGRFPISKLEFPMNMILATFRMQGESEKLNFDLQLKKSILSTAAKFKDSDWITNINPNQIDVYSESDSTIDAFILDASLDYKVTSISNDIKNYIGLGYIKQNLYFEAENTVQEYPSNPSTPSVTIPGLTITYKVDYNIFYLYYRAYYNIDSNTRFNVKIGYSPSVIITDLDNHVIRNRITKGKLNGYANILDFSIDFRLDSESKFNFNIHYMGVTADGRQTQATNGRYTGTIDEKITSSQTSLGVKYYYLF